MVFRFNELKIINLNYEVTVHCSYYPNMCKGEFIFPSVADSLRQYDLSCSFTNENENIVIF